jgi:hypothetical protein
VTQQITLLTDYWHREGSGAFQPPGSRSPTLSHSLGAGGRRFNQIPVLIKPSKERERAGLRLQSSILSSIHSLKRRIGVAVQLAKHELSRFYFRGGLDTNSLIEGFCSILRSSRRMEHLGMFKESAKIEW